MLKRTFDFLIALLALIILSPIFVILCWLIKRRLGSPIFFRQTRPGKNGKPFEMIKFRTMTDAYDNNGNSLPDSARLTPFGKMLRFSSLDELPELWNILKGDMSLVGPRPLLMEYLSLYNKEQNRRHEVRPGITGWAQVNGRNAISWEEKFKLDVWYVDHRNLWLDIKIIVLTIIKVFLKEGINSAGEVTTSKFPGNKKNKTIAILGASGHGKVIADIAEQQGLSCVFFDDNWPNLQMNAHWPVVGDSSTLLEKASNYFGVAVAIGNNKIRLEKIKLLQQLNIQLPIMKHPGSSISSYAQIGEGTVILAGVVVNAYAKIGKGCILNTSSSIDHDCILEDCVHISPGARLAGGVTVKECAWVGIGAAIKQLITVGAYSQVGAGAVVVKNVSENTTVVGVPAKNIS